MYKIQTAILPEELAMYFRTPMLFDPKNRRIEPFETIGATLETKDFDIAIFGVETDYKSSEWNRGTEFAPDYIRSFLYQMPFDFKDKKIADLGNVRAENGESAKVAVRNIISELSKMGVICIVLGGSSAILPSIVSGIGGSGRNANVAIADASLEFASRYDEHCYIPSFLDEIVAEERVRNLDILAVQNYLASDEQMSEMDNRRIVFTRLAAVQQDIMSFEPILRDSDLFAISARSIRSADMPGQGIPQPNGLYGQEACFLAKLAGNSDRNTAFALTEFNPLSDSTNSSSYLSAQIVWHYIQGVANRYGDYPVKDISGYSTYKIFDPPTNQEIDFYNNPLNGRWWVRIPSDKGTEVYSCTKADYECMSNRGMPSIWRRHFMK